MSGARVHPTNPFTEFRKEDIEKTIPDRFEHMADRYSDQTAIKTRRHRWTYRELNRAANRIARAILNERGEGEEHVALIFEKEAPVFAAILGVLKAGKTYVPMDPLFPDARNTYILEDSQAALILTNQPQMPLSNELSGGRIPIINTDEMDPGLSEENLCLDVSPDTRTWILYTSGSTGEPKGVVQTNRNVLHMVMNYTNYLHISHEDRLTLLYSVSFNAAKKDTFGALLNGATLCPFDLKQEGIHQLPEWMKQEKISLYRSGATVFRHFVSHLSGEERFPHLRIVYPGAEPVYTRDVELCRKHFGPDCLFVNGLGSTESPQFRWIFFDHESPLHGTSLPVGYPVRDMESFLLDENGHEVGPGEEGEITVKSQYITPGYWRKPEATQAVFTIDPEDPSKRIFRTGDMGRMLPDGNLICLGRKDFQVMIKGVRIEVSEIEMALLELEQIKEAVVWPWRDQSGEQILVAYMVPEYQPLPTVSTLRRELEKKLPAQMIPSAFVWMDKLPLTPTLKVNRRALPPPENQRPALDAPFVSPRTTIEEEVAHIWSQVLNLDEVGVQDPFLEIGGDSLRATQLISRVFDRFQVDVPIHTLMQAPTIADMAEAILMHKTHQIGTEEMGRLLDEVEKSSEKE